MPLGVQTSGSDTFGIPDKVPGCDPINRNHSNLTPPLPFFGATNVQIFNPDGTPGGGGGLQQPLVTKPRVIQFALKAIW